MKYSVLLIIWMMVSLFLVLSVIGIILFLPGSNDTSYYIPVSERRSTWCTIGVKLLDKII